MKLVEDMLEGCHRLTKAVLNARGKNANKVKARKLLRINRIPALRETGGGWRRGTVA